MNVKALADVQTHHDVPETTVGSLREFAPSSSVGVSKYSIDIPGNGTLKAMLVNKQCDVLVVAFHGATSRAKKEIPRFEWFRTLRDEPVSSLYFSDPLLETDPTLELAWFTGKLNLDLHAEIARVTRVAAEAIGAQKIIFLGSSGGGFAALQVATHVEGSLALPFSPQTSISRYLVKGTGYGAQRKYLELVMPELRPEVPLHKLDPNFDWAEPAKLRLSAVERYVHEVPNRVMYVQNSNDYPHVEQHLNPFRSAIGGGVNDARIVFEVYAGPESHNPPARAEFKQYLGMAVDLLEDGAS